MLFRPASLRLPLVAAAVAVSAVAGALPPASYFRSRPAKVEVGSGVFARDEARRIAAADRFARGELEVVGVGWTFPSNRVDWLFDASAKKGPYNPDLLPVTSGLVVALILLRLIPLYQLYQSAMPRRRIPLLILNILGPFSPAVTIFAVRDYDQGMPPRHAPAAETLNEDQTQT